MHGAMPQLSSAAASAAVDHDGEPISLSGIRTDHALVGLRLSEPQILILEVFHMTTQIRNEGIYNSLIAQLDKIARHNRQGSYRTKERYYKAMKRFCCFLAEEHYHQDRSGGYPLLS